MKCKVCGYELAEGRSYCPMCGTKTEAAVRQRTTAATDMAWNTKDFPKPRKMEDIEMNWGNTGTSFMKNDASEGFVTVRTENDAQPVRDFEIPSFMNQQRQPAPAKPQADVSRIQFNGASAQPRNQAPVQTQAPVQPRNQAPVQTQAPVQARNQAPVQTQSKQPAINFDNIRQSSEPSLYMPRFDVFPPSAPAQQYTEPVSVKAPETTPLYVPVQPQQRPAENQFWYEQDFTASGKMKTGPAYPLSHDAYTAPNPAIGIDAQRAASVIESAIPEATVQYVRVQEPKPVPVQPQTEPVQQYVPVQSQPAEPVQQYVPVQPQTEPVQQYVPVQSQPAEPFAYETANPDYDAISVQAEKRPEQFYTFQAKNDEFQKLLDEEYRRINAMHGADTSVVPPQTFADTFIPQNSVRAQDISAFERSLFGMSEASAAPVQSQSEPIQQYVPVQPAAPVTPAAPVQTTPQAVPETSALFNEKETTDIDLYELISDPLDPRFDIDTLELTIRELKIAEEKDDEKRSERRKKLEAMERAREAYFKALDEEAGITDASSIDPDIRPRSTDIFSPEKKKERVYVPNVKISEEKPVREDNVPAAEDLPVPEAENAISDFDQLKDIPSADEPKRDAEETVLPEKTGREEASELIAETDAEAAPLDGSGEASENSPEEDKNQSELNPALKGLYDDDDDEDDEEREGHGHGFLRFLGILIVIIAVIELAILALKNFVPDAEITATAIQIETAAIDAVTNIAKGLSAWINGLKSN